MLTPKVEEFYNKFHGSNGRFSSGQGSPAIPSERLVKKVSDYAAERVKANEHLKPNDVSYVNAKLQRNPERDTLRGYHTTMQHVVKFPPTSVQKLDQHLAEVHKDAATRITKGNSKDNIPFQQGRLSAAKELRAVSGIPEDPADD